MLIAEDTSAHEALMELSMLRWSSQGLSLDVCVRTMHTTRIEGKGLAKATILLDGRDDTKAVLRHT